MERAVLSTLKGLMRYNHDIEVICFHATGVLTDAFKSLKIPITECRLHRWNMPWVIWKVMRHIREKRCQLIHSHGYHADVVARIAAHFTGIPCINTIHTNSTWKREPKGIYQHWKHFLDIYTARHFGRWFIALSDSIRQFHIGTLRYPPTTWRIIPNPVDFDRLIEGRETIEETRSMMGVNPRDVLCLTVGNLLPVKGHVHLIEAAALLPKDVMSRVHIFIAGEGPERARLEEIIERHQMESRIKLIGYQENIGPFMQAADVFLMPSVSEGQSLAILEAMICGKGIIVTSQGAHRDYLQHGVNALIVPPSDTKALSHELARLVLDVQLRDKLGTAAKETVAALPVTNAVPMIEEFYREVVTCETKT